MNLCASVCSVTQLCPILCDPVDCSLPGSPVHGIPQARLLEWVAILFSRGSFWPRDWTHQVSHIAGRRFNIWATRKARTLPKSNQMPSKRLLLVTVAVEVEMVALVASSAYSSIVFTGCMILQNNRVIQFFNYSLYTRHEWQNVTLVPIIS